MATSRTTFQDGPAGDGAPAPDSSFVWVSLHDPSAEETTSGEVQLVLGDGLVVAHRRPAQATPPRGAGPPAAVRGVRRAGQPTHAVSR